MGGADVDFQYRRHRFLVPQPLRVWPTCKIRPALPPLSELWFHPDQGNYTSPTPSLLMWKGPERSCFLLYTHFDIQKHTSAFKSKARWKSREAEISAENQFNDFNTMENISHFTLAGIFFLTLIQFFFLKDKWWLLWLDDLFQFSFQKCLWMCVLTCREYE